MMVLTRMAIQWASHFLFRASRKLRTIYRPNLSRDIDIAQIQSDQLDFVEPCFVLSTGRCGTRWLTELLRLSRYVAVNHADYPELIHHSRLAYEFYDESPLVFQEIIRATRDEYIIDAYRHNQVYVETNNRITFFARAVKQVYPRAKFIHLIRHPGHFVRSGLNRNWYRGHPHDIGRIVKSDSTETWQKMSDSARITWLWNETNRYIEFFLQELSPQDYLQVKAEDMLADSTTAMDLTRFVEARDISLKMIQWMMRRNINRQRTWSISPYHTWSDEKKEPVRRHSDLATKYGYNL